MVFRQRREDVHRIFELVMANQADLPVRTMCRVLGVSSSGWHACPLAGPPAESTKAPPAAAGR